MNTNEAYARWKAASGDEKDIAMAALVETMREHALAVLYKESSRRLEDVAAEATYKAIDQIFQFEGRALFSTWFERIVRNTYKDSVRSKWDKRYSDAKEVELDGMEPSSGGSPEEAAAIKELLESLSPQQRKVAELISQGYTMQEVAIKLGMSYEAALWIKETMQKRFRDAGH